MKQVAFERKVENLYAFWYLLCLKSHNLEKKSIYRIQNRKIRKLMKRAYEIPLYRKKFDEVGMRPEDFKTKEDLAKFPLLTKEELKSWISPMLEENVEKYKNHHIYTTSGSTGTPLKLCASPKENAYFTANWLRIAMENGINPFFDQTMALKDPAIVAKGRESFIQKFKILRRHKISFLADGSVIAQEINRIKPDFLYAHRTKLMQTIEYTREKNLSLYKPKAYASISETLTEQSIKLFREYLGENLFTSFGSMETGACTFTRISNIQKHIITNDTHVINIVDNNNCLAKQGRMIITNLFLYEFPIINYDIGDGACKVVENEIEYLEKIQGRLNDWIELEDGSKYDYHPFYAATENIKEILSFRVIQNSYHKITLELVPDTKYAIDKESVESIILEKLKSVIRDENMVYQFCWKQQIEADANGKLRFIVNQIKK